MMQKIIHTVIHAGLEKPVKIMHLTDVHLTFANEKDPLKQAELEKIRTDTFYREGGCCPHTPAEYFAEGIALAEEMGAVIVCTGDVMDIQTFGNAEKFHQIADGHDLLFSPGGHEQQKQCVRTMEEPDGFWRTSRQRLAEWFPEFPLDLESRVVNGLNIVTADNSLDYFSRKTLEVFQKELAKGYPVLVFSHDPIDDPLLNAREKTHENVELTPEDYAVSHEMIDLIQNDPRVLAFIGGHEHREREGLLKSGHPHYVTPGVFAGICRLIEVD